MNDIGLRNAYQYMFRQINQRPNYQGPTYPQIQQRFRNIYDNYAQNRPGGLTRYAQGPGGYPPYPNVIPQGPRYRSNQTY